jgi:hypothetical protein
MKCESGSLTLEILLLAALAAGVSVAVLPVIAETVSAYLQRLSN